MIFIYSKSFLRNFYPHTQKNVCVGVATISKIILEFLKLLSIFYPYLFFQAKIDRGKKWICFLFVGFCIFICRFLYQADNRPEKELKSKLKTAFAFLYAPFAFLYAPFAFLYAPFAFLLQLNLKIQMV
jgi:hypothetical protein